MIIVADISALFAAFDVAQAGARPGPRGDGARAAGDSPMALTELDHLVHRSVGFPAAMQVMTALTARIAITPLTAGIDAFRILPADT